MNFMLGITFLDWMKLLSQNHFDVNPRYWSRAFKITIMSMFNSRMKKKENKIYSGKIYAAKVSDPIFILGHWRSGTTLVHKLLTLDEQFAYPNLFQVTHPHSFLFREELIEKALGNKPAEKRPMDNMQVTFRDPGEDESAISVMSQCSPLIGWGFTKKQSYYANFHTFENVKAEDTERWKSSFVWFLKKLTLRYNKSLVLKSPIHTGRIKLLLDLFPGAKFIHIYRDPLTVFQSTKRLYKKMLPTTCLQTVNQDKWDNYIIENYKTMYDSFFKYKDSIPKNQLIEIKFEEFENNIVENMKNIYNQLELNGFSNVQHKLNKYVSDLSGYKKNKHDDLKQNIKNKLAKEWSKNFKEWDYTS